MTEETGLIPPGYLFSQHSLNTYLRCPRRFLLKYVEHQPWPMPEEQDPLGYEAHLARGRVLHHWLARHHLGLEMEPIVAATPDPNLQAWWRAALHFDRAALPQGLREAELPVVVPLGRYRLYARYDYLALDPAGDAVIVDWKTLETRPSAKVLRQRVQTRVYLYTLVAAGHVLTGGAHRPGAGGHALLVRQLSRRALSGALFRPGLCPRRPTAPRPGGGDRPAAAGGLPAHRRCAPLRPLQLPQPVWA